MIPGSIAAVLGASQELSGELVSYIRGFAIGLPFFCIGTQFTAFLQLERQEKRYQRLNVLDFQPVECDEVVLRVLATNGIADARVYEVRVY